jgi:radical SAM protein with 4Fe4S-binding SPASM domain
MGANMGFESFPFVVGWELTLACNLRCRHCGSSAALPRPDELSLQESLAICDQFPDLLVQEVDFTGGEPLLRPDWQPIAMRLRDLGIFTKVVTNGLTLTPDTVARLQDAGIVGLGVSIDGLSDPHDSIRNCAGAFDRSVAGIKRALEAGLPVTVITTVNALNVGELSGLHALLRSIGVRKWQVQPIFPLGRGQLCSDLILSPPAYMRLGAFVLEWGPHAAETGLDILPGDSYGYYTELDTREPPWRGCNAGQVLCGITSNGKIKGCLSMPDDLIQGDLRERDLWDIWFDKDAFAYTRHYSPDQLGPGCRSCDRAEQCRGGCSSMSYACTGTFHSDPYCFYRIQTG